MVYSIFLKINRTHILSSIFIILSLSVVAQSGQNIVKKSGLKLAFQPFVTEKLEIYRPYANRTDANFISKKAIGFEGRLAYTRMIGQRFQLTGGIIIGVYPMYFEIFFDSSFSQLDRNFHHYSLDRITAIYSGISFNGEYLKAIDRNNFLSVGVGINYVIFIPQFYSYNIRIHDGSQIYQVFSAKADMNPTEKAFIAPEFSIGYHRKIGQKFIPYLLAKGVYSSNRPIVGRSFSIFGKSETLEGSFKKQFAHVGIEVGLRYSL